MKQPQCNTSADCLRELARVMDQFGFTDSYLAITSHFVKYDGMERGWSMHPSRELPYFASPSRFSFAIAEVEGKPVFIGDELYYFDRKIIAGAVINGVIANAAGGMNYSPSSLSWNPPKPATVMVELPYDYARNRAAQNCTPDATLVNACKTALEKLKS